MEYDFSVYAVALSRIFAFKCREARELIRIFTSPEKIFIASRESLTEVMGSGKEYIEQILNPKVLDWAAREVSWCLSNGVKLLYIESKAYPSRLRECCDAPVILYARGDANLNPERSLAIVGTRKSTFYGRNRCRHIIGELARNRAAPLIVSGLAFGIDAAAHIAALDTGLETVAVLPTGIDTIYPLQHRELASRIVRQGALVSDFARGTQPMPLTFVKRNRIIAGMADATFVAESFAKGGSLITATQANSYDREVFALPGRVDDTPSEGCNNLIERNIAHIVTSGASIERVMGWDLVAPKSKLYEPCLFEEDDSPQKIGVLKYLNESGASDVDTISAQCRIPLCELSPTLLELEMSGRIISVQGRKYALP